MRVENVLLWLILVISPLVSTAQAPDYLKQILAQEKSEQVLGKEIPIRPQMHPLGYALLPNGEQFLMGSYWYTYSSGLESYFFIAKLAADGEPVWTQSRKVEYPLISSGPTSWLLPRQDGGVWALIPEGHTGHSLTQLDANGTVVSQQEWGQAQDNRLLDAILGSNDEIYILRIVTENHVTVGHNLLKIDANGNQVADLLLDAPISDTRLSLNRMALTQDDGVVIAGQRGGYVNGQYLSNPILLKLNATNDILWSYEYQAERPFSVVGLAPNGDGTTLVLGGFFDQVSINLSGNGIPEAVFIQQSDRIDPSIFTHEPGASFSDGQTFMALSPISNYSGESPDGQWVISSWDNSGSLNWSYYHALFLENLEWIRPVGMGKTPNGNVGFVGMGYTVYPENVEHVESILLANFHPDNAENSSCVGKAIPWNSEPGTIDRISMNWTRAAYSSPSPSTPNYVFSPDSLFTATLCENTGGGSVAVLKNVPVRIGPNPVIDQAEVSVETALGEVEMRITDPSGRVFMQETHNIEAAGSMQLDMGKMEAGVYLITLRGANFIWREKVIKAE